MDRMLFVLLLAASLGVAAAEHGAPQESAFGVRFGFDHTEGKYDQPRQTSLDTASITLTYEVGDWSFDVAAPYLREKGPGRIIFLPGRRPFVIIGPDRTSSGAGDVTGAVTRYLLNEEDRGFDLDVGAIVKLGTASSDKGLGTGKNDLSLHAALGRSFGPVLATVMAGYTFVGKAPGLDLMNAAYGSVDMSYRLGDPVRTGLTYSVGQTASRGTPGSRDLTAYVDIKLTKTNRVEVYVLKGFTNQSPDRGAGFTVSFDL